MDKVYFPILEPKRPFYNLITLNDGINSASIFISFNVLIILLLYQITLNSKSLKTLHFSINISLALVVTDFSFSAVWPKWIIFCLNEDTTVLLNDVLPEAIGPTKRILYRSSPSCSGFKFVIMDNWSATFCKPTNYVLLFYCRE